MSLNDSFTRTTSHPYETGVYLLMAGLKRIWLYGVKTHGNQRADQYHQGMLDRFAHIAEQPYLYQAVDSIRAGYRRSVYGTDSIYYRINDGTVEIMTILGHQDTEDWL